MIALETFRELELADIKHLGEIVPGVHAYGAKRPMGRIRAYTSAGLTPFAGRGAPSEVLLLGHVHVDAKGRASVIEGFNGAEGERWAKRAEELLTKADLLAPEARVTPFTPLRGCAHTGVR